MRRACTKAVTSPAGTEHLQERLGTTPQSNSQDREGLASTRSTHLRLGCGSVALFSTPDIGALGPQLTIILDRRTITTESTDKKNLHHRAESRVNFHWQITPRDQTNRAASGYTTAAHRPVSSIQICPVALGERSTNPRAGAGLGAFARVYQHTWTRPLGSTQHG